MKLQRRAMLIIFSLSILFFPSLSPGLSPKSQAGGTAEAIHRTAVSLYNTGEYEKAIEAFKRAIHQNPDVAESYYFLGMAYSSLGKYKEAVEAYNHAVRINPGYAAAYQNLGHAYSNLTQYGKAITAFQKAIQFAPDNLEPYFGLGNAYFDAGKVDKAVDTYEAAIQRKPDDPYAYYNLGLLYLPVGQHARAVDAFSQVIVRDPRYAAAYFHRAYAYLFLGRGESATGDVETYLALKGWRAEHSLDMALVAYFGYLQGRRANDAKKILESAAREADPQAWPFAVVEYLRQKISPQQLVSMAPDQPKKVAARAYIGINLYLQGDPKAAVDHLKWALDHGDQWSLPLGLALSSMERIKTRSTVSPDR